MTTALQIKHDTVGGHKATDTQLIVSCMGGGIPDRPSLYYTSQKPHS